MTHSDSIPIESDSTLATVRARLESEIDRSVRQLLNDADQALGVDGVGTILQDYLVLPGKRLRPLLLVLCLRALDPDHEIGEDVVRLAAGLEFFHEFLLIHDDLIDSGDTRRGAPTLWCRLRDTAGLSAENARSVALILGDLLYAQAIDNVAAHSGQAETTNRALRYLMGIAKQTGWGAISEIQFSEEGIETISAEAIEAVYQAKTTRYSFEAPMILAAVLAHVSEQEQVALAALAHPLGQAFQLENDLHELLAWGENPDAISTDLKGHIKTLPMVRLYQALDPDDRARLSAILESPNTRPHRQSFTEMMARSDLVSLVRDEIDRLFDEPDHLLEDSPFPDPTRIRIAGMIGYIRTHRNHSES